MAYFSKYITDFSEYQLLIKTNGLSGSLVTLQASNPFISHAWDSDDPIAPIKGSSLTANIIGTPLKTFYSDSDKDFKGELYKGSQLLFSGFLVQDDCIENVDDLVHSVTVSFTDNIGLLKNVSFGDAIAEPSTTSLQVHLTTSGNAINTGFPFVPGDVFTILGAGVEYGTFTIDTDAGGGDYTTTTVLPTLSGFYVIAVSKVLTESKISLFAVIQACIRSTGLDLPLEIFSNLYEDTQSGTSGSFFEQTLIARETFIKSGREYKSCYDVLEMVLERFKATLVQANGQWNIIRWFEHAPASWRYTADFARLGTGGYTGLTKSSGFEQSIYPEYGYTQRVFRSYKEVKETFKYDSTILFQNQDLHDLGAFISTQTVTIDGVDIRYDDYEITGLINNPGNDAFIRVETDIITDTEIDRYIYQPYHGSGDALGKFFSSNLIEVNKDDKIDLSFQYRAAEDSGSSTQYRFATYLHVDGSNTWALVSSDSDPTHAITALVWVLNPTFTTFSFDQINGSSDQAEYSNFTLSTFRGPIPNLPANGLLEFVFLSESVTPAAKDSITKDFRFTYLAFVNKSIRITGQTHKQTQNSQSNNILEQDIMIDDAPRNPLKGALFLNSKTGYLQNRTKGWNAYLGASMRLGALTTMEVKQWRSKARTILEGTLHGDVLVSPMTTFTNPAFPDLNFIPGRMEIDYANKTCKGTLHELYETGETPAGSDYSFEYIYDTK